MQQWESWDVDFIVTFLCSMGFVLILCSQLTVAYATYVEASNLFHENQWMRVQCHNQTFYVHMQLYSSICDDVLSMKDPYLQSIDAALKLDLKILIAALSLFTLIVGKCLWNLIKCVFRLHDYINLELPK